MNLARCAGLLAVATLVACQRPAGGPSPVPAAQAAALAPAGFGPAYRVRGLSPSFGGDAVGFGWNGKLLLNALPSGEGGLWGLWITDGSEAGTRLLRPRLSVARGGFQGDAAFVAMGGVLYFAATEYQVDSSGVPRTESGAELWRTDGTPEGTWLVADVNAGAAASFPSELTVARGALYFVAGYDGSGQGSHLGLFRSDGTAAGTVRVAALWGTSDATYPSWPIGLTAAGANLFFTYDPGTGRELYRVATCPGAAGPECPALVRRLRPAALGSLGSMPTMLVALGDLLLFAADGTDGRGIYRSDGTEAGTTLVALADYFGPVNRERLSVAEGRYAYFLDHLRAALWRTDGTAAGTESLGAGHVPWQYWMTKAGGLVYFWGADPVPNASSPTWSNAEVWRTDGTASGTRVHWDLCPGSCSSWNPTGGPPLALEPEGRLFLGGSQDGTEAGAGLWTSDGTAGGTSLVQDFHDRTDVGWPWGLVRSGDLVFFGLLVPGPFTARYGIHEKELWAVRIDLADRAPPVLSCPGDLVAEATSDAGAQVLFAVAARDNLTPGVQPAVSHDPGPFPLGVTPVTASVSDAAGNTAQCTFAVTVRDATPPIVSCPPSMAVEALSSAGTPVSFAVAAADAASAPAVEAVPASGSTFPLGSTAVTATARDAAGNLASCGFTVTVADATAPALSCPPDQALDLAAPEGAPGAWPDALALDVVSAAGVAYEPARGSILAPGSHAVVATAADAGGNRSSCAFTVTVRDTAAPAVTCPADVAVQAASVQGARVDFAAPSATDAGTAAPAIALSHASGSLFPVGATTVEATARDAAGNVGSCAFRVEVQAAPPSGTEPTPPPGTQAASSGSGCSAGAGGPLSLLLLAALRLRRGRAR